jgi:hypothetical protein
MVIKKVEQFMVLNAKIPIKKCTISIGKIAILQSNIVKSQQQQQQQ